MEAGAKEIPLLVYIIWPFIVAYYAFKSQQEQTTNRFVRIVKSAAVMGMWFLTASIAVLLPIPGYIAFVVISIAAYAIGIKIGLKAYRRRLTPSITPTEEE